MKYHLERAGTKDPVAASGNQSSPKAAIMMDDRFFMASSSLMCGYSWDLS